MEYLWIPGIILVFVAIPIIIGWAMLRWGGQEEPHIGFCLCEYDDDKCAGCPALDDCLDLRDKERGEKGK